LVGFADRFVYAYFRSLDRFSLLLSPFLTTGLWNDQEFASWSRAVVRSLVTSPASLGDIDPRGVSARFPVLAVLGEVPMPWNPLLEPPMLAARTDLWFYHPFVDASDDGVEEEAMASDSC
jgi:hypothetical protein